MNRISVNEGDSVVDPPEDGEICVHISVYEFDGSSVSLYLTKEDVENMLSLFKEGD